MGRSSTRRSGDDGNSQPPKRRRHRYNTRHSSRMLRDKALGGEQDARKTVVSDSDFREKVKVLKEEKIGSALTVKELDTHNQENAKKHFTDQFNLEELIIRRGQDFMLTLTFDRKVNKDADLVVLQFSVGARPQESKGTIIRLPISFGESASGDKEDDDWTVTVTKVEGDKLTVSVKSEPDSNIGKYTLYVETKVKGSDKDFSRDECDEIVYMLFNPWCEDDVVYMKNEKERNEYVLNDQGQIWIGSAWSNRKRPWNFGQFESPVLEVALDLLDKAELGDSARNSAVSVIRCFSAMVNSMDENGLLMGRWTKEYPEDCTKPWVWNGSVSIIDEFKKTQKPVRFGQCWVFSGVVTTLCRCLGIPTRSITNFDSAHDCDCSMTIDEHLDEDGRMYNEGDMDDSTWNFHVWNESFLKRVDLPDGYDGWQAHDATPQEESEGVSRCGPAPVKAIKNGHVYLSFDTGFIFSEVNGDKVCWQVDSEGKMKVIEINRYAVGRNISTKAVGSDERLDVTHEYKYPEGSAEERKVVKFVNRYSTRKRQNIYKIKFEKQVTMEPIIPDDKLVGDDIEVGVKVTNQTSEKKTLKVTLTFASTFYTGVVGKVIKDQVVEKTVEPNKSANITMEVTSDEYKAGMNSMAQFKLTSVCKVEETKRMFVNTESFALLTPDLIFDIKDQYPSYTKLEIPVTFKNDTNLKLHNALMHAEGSYLVVGKYKTIRAGKIIHPGEEFTVNIPIKAYRLGERKLMVTFSSDEVADVADEATINVVSKSDYEGEEKMEDEDEN